MNTIHDVSLIEAQTIPGEHAGLSIYPGESLIPFRIRRIFTVHARKATTRGYHAHKTCSQAMVCLAGSCNVIVDDGRERGRWRLDHPSQVMIVPPLLWSEQEYDNDQTILMVMCDQDYDENEYLRDYQAFLVYRQNVPR